MWITECNGHCGCNSEMEFFCHLRFDASHSEHWSQLLSCHEQITGLSETGTVQRDGEQYSNIFERKKKKNTWRGRLHSSMTCFVFVGFGWKCASRVWKGNNIFYECTVIFVFFPQSYSNSLSNNCSVFENAFIRVTHSFQFHSLLQNGTMIHSVLINFI